jgi:hypothetical protein
MLDVLPITPLAWCTSLLLEPHTLCISAMDEGMEGKDGGKRWEINGGREKEG